jgi:hypothetical protein
MSEKTKDSHPTYLITKDVKETIENKFGLHLSKRANAKIDRLSDEFVRKFWKVSGLPQNVERCERSASELSGKLMAMLRKTGYDVISLDRVYVPNAPAYLEVTRKTDPQTDAVTISERSGTRPLPEQLASLKKYENVAVVDVGAYGGDTLLEVCRMLDEQGTCVKEIYLGVAGDKVSAKIDGRRELNVIEEFNLYEWIELRDFLGIDGRYVGLSKSGNKLYRPYWENLVKWASIPEENEPKVAELCSTYAAKLMTILRSEIDEKTIKGRIGEIYSKD